MIHYRIIGVLWFFAGAWNAATFPFEVWRTLHGAGSADHPALFWVSQSLVEACFIFLALLGVGLFRLRPRAAPAARVVAVVSLFVLLWFITSQGRQHGPQPFYAAWFGVAFCMYQLIVLWKFPLTAVASPQARA